MISSRSLGLAALAALMLAGAAGTPGPSASESPFIRVEDDGNRLVVRRTAPVQFTALDQLITAVQDPLPPHGATMRLIRAHPPEMIEYVLCVTEEGTLVLGQQVRAMGLAGQDSVFVRGEIARSYQPLETNPLSWLVTLPLSRTRDVTLRVTAGGTRWPLESVTIDLLRH